MDNREPLQTQVTYNITINLPSLARIEPQHKERGIFLVAALGSFWRLIVNLFTTAS
jgi:hypothetical protein